MYLEEYFEVSMAVNTRTEYALRALLEMQNVNTEPISAQRICLRQQLPKKYVEHLLSALKTAGLVSSSAGSRGGYTLSRKAEEISLLDVMEAVDDHSWELDCGENRGDHCLGDECQLSPFFHKISKEQRRLFASYSLVQIASVFEKKGDHK